MDDLVSLERVRSTVNLVHFQGTEYLDTIVKDKLFHFQNVRKYSHEQNIISLDAEFYAADSLGAFCFSHDVRAVFNADMWRSTQAKALLKAVCIGFWEAGAEAVANVGATAEQAVAMYKRNRRKMVNNYHQMSERVYTGRASYLEKADLDRCKNLQSCTQEMIDKAKEIMLLTFEPSDLSRELEERFIILDCQDQRDVSYVSRFIPRPKLIILGPEVCDLEAEKHVEKYRDQVNSIWKATIGMDDKVAVRRVWN